MKFKKEVLQDLLLDSEYQDSEDNPTFELKIISNKIIGQSRWNTFHLMVFSHTSSEGTKYYESQYSVGSTEMQYEGPYEYEPEEIDCPEVVPKEVIVVKYVRI